MPRTTMPLSGLSRSCATQPHGRYPVGRWSVWGILLLVTISLTTTGCVRRRLTVRSNPPGALLYIDNQQLGTTPCSVDFTYYGTREIRLVKSGFETLTVNQPIPAPWYQVPPLDFLSDNFLPSRIRDNRTVNYTLQPQLIASFEQVIGRGEGLRQQFRSSVVPASAAGETPVSPLLPTPTLAPAPGEFSPREVLPPALTPPAAAPSATPPLPATTPAPFRY